MRSRTPRFAPSVDHPEVLELYIEAIRKFISKCPEVEILVFRTNDSGAGFDWAPGLYNGANGNTNYRGRDTQDRIRGILGALQQGAREAGRTLAVHVYNTKEKNRNLAKGLEANLVIDGLEGPDAGPFSTDVETLLYYRRAFSTIAGIPRPLNFIEQLENAGHSQAPRLFVYIFDRHNKGLYLKIYNEFWKSPTQGIIDNLQFLRKVAASEVGEGDTEKLFGLWMALDEAQKSAQMLNMGGSVFILGCVHQRWLVRPLVPFPSELAPEEKDYYHRHQFTARSEEETDNLMLMQGSSVFADGGGNMFLNIMLRKPRSNIDKAARSSRELAKSGSKEQQREYGLLSTRLTAFGYLITNVLNTANYQRKLDQIVSARSQAGDGNTALNMDLSKRSAIQQIARSEIDNTVNLVKLLAAQQQARNIIDHAKTSGEEYQRLLGADLIEQLRKKIKTMNAHWMDYNRIFTAPNL